MNKPLLLSILFIAGHNLFAQEINQCAKSRISQYNSIASRTEIQSAAFSDYDVKFYFLDIEADNQSTHVKGKVTIKAQVKTDGMTQFVVELINDLTVDSVYVNQSKVTFSHSSGQVVVNLPSALAAAQIIDVTFYYQGTPPSGGFFSGISNAFSPTGQRVTWTLSEPLNAHDWFPVKQVLEDKADSAYIFITVPDHLKAGASGLLTNVKSLNNNRLRFEWKTRYPIAYYLLSMTISTYVEYNTYAHPDGADPILIQNFVYDDTNTLPTYKNEIDEVGHIIELYSNLFGLYPFHNEKYGHCMAPIGGGMEHQTMTTLDRFNFTLDAHELGHQWFGDNVTCKSWRDIWVNEGFASYTEYLAQEFLKSKAVADSWMSNNYFNVISQVGGSVYVPEAQATNENRIFDSRLTYNKGGALLHMIRNIINDDEVFFGALKTYQVQYKNSTATGEDFKNVLNANTSFNFDEFFNDWYYGEGYPIFNIKWNSQRDTLIIVQKQTTSHASVDFYNIPVDYYVKYADDTEEIIRLTVTKPLDTLRLPLHDNVTQLTFDPQHWLLKKVLSVTKDPGLIDPAPVVLGVEKNLNEEFDIYPNPAKNKLTISTDQSDYNFRLMDMMGRVVLSNERLTGEYEMTTAGIAQGMYILEISNGGQLLTRKIKID